MRFKVELRTNGVWADAGWTIITGQQREPERFDSPAEANAAIAEQLEETTKLRNASHPDHYIRDNYRVCPDPTGA